MTELSPYKHPLLVVICGWPTAGKTTSLRGLRNQDKWVFGNIEQKQIPFKNTFKSIDLPKTSDVKNFINAAKNQESIEGTILDGMDMYFDKWENENVKGSGNGLASWAEYQQMTTELVQRDLRAFKRDVILTWHLHQTIDEKTQKAKDSLAMKGALGRKGAELLFTNIFTAKCLDLTDLQPYENDLLTITDLDKKRGFKHVIQTQKTKETMNEPTRSLTDAFSIDETFIDCNLQLVLDRLHKFTEENY